MVCSCGHANHDWETQVCNFPGCWCMQYEELKDNQTVIPRHQKYLEQYEKTEEKVKYILENIPETKELKNKDFVFFYWHMVHKLNIINNQVIKELTDPESIRRSRQLLVQHNRDKYGPTNQDFIDEKYDKESGTYQYVMEKYR